MTKDTFGVVECYTDKRPLTNLSHKPNNNIISSSKTTGITVQDKISLETN
jgi:hypothetical protein